jgi:septum formation protein
MRVVAVSKGNVYMIIKQPRIYLCSQSPRRRELLKQIGINFEMLLLRTDPRRHKDVDEAPLIGETPEEHVQRVCRDKARAGYAAMQFRNLPKFPVMAADTIVALDGHILGKPANAKEAEQMLRLLSGREHQVLSAVGLAVEGNVGLTMSVSKVRFTKLSDERINVYLRTNEYSDKAGGYAIQGLAAAFIENIEGSYSGVMGLPIFETVELLKRYEYPAP